MTIAAIVAGSMLLLSTGFTPGGVTIGLITKYVLVVEKRSEAVQWKQVGAGEQLVSGDQVKTGEKSLAIIKFKDNSVLRVREQTQLTVNGEISGKAFSKNVVMEKGSFGFNVRKQENEKFMFQSPTSVASIRGTRGIRAFGMTGDTTVVYEGLVNVVNLVTNESVDVAEGYILLISSDGTMTLRKATQEELDEASRASTDSTQDLNDLDLELKDSQGKTKDLRIKYKK